MTLRFPSALVSDVRAPVAREELRLAKVFAVLFARTGGLDRDVSFNQLRLACRMSERKLWSCLKGLEAMHDVRISKPSVKYKSWGGYRRTWRIRISQRSPRLAQLEGGYIELDDELVLRRGVGTLQTMLHLAVEQHADGMLTLPTRELADRCGHSERTVRRHRNQVLDALHLDRPVPGYCLAMMCLPTWRVGRWTDVEVFGVRMRARVNSAEKEGARLEALLQALDEQGVNVEKAVSQAFGDLSRELGAWNAPVQPRMVVRVLEQRFRRCLEGSTRYGRRLYQRVATAHLEVPERLRVTRPAPVVESEDRTLHLGVDRAARDTRSSDRSTSEWVDLLGIRPPPIPAV